MLVVRQSRLFSKIAHYFVPNLGKLHAARVIMATAAQERVKLNDSLITIDTDAYDSQLQAKQAMVVQQFAEFQPPKLEVHRSKPKNYRMRCALRSPCPSFTRPNFI